MSCRADKFVWAVRLSATRSDAAEALRSGKILVSDHQAKPSREVVVGETIQVKHLPAVFSYRVIALTDRRVGAKLVGDFIEDITLPIEREKLELARLDTFGRRDRGAGRPTKRDRRELEDFLGE
ncbi:MAG: RNA-binding S4 domain-containing protein [Mucinivorans sp.]